MGCTYSVIALVQWYRQGKKMYGHEGYTYAKNNVWKDPELKQIEMPENGLYLVTGANGGIGSQVVSDILYHGGKVGMLCRNEERGQAARTKIIEDLKMDNVEERVFVEIVDVSDMNSVRAFADRFKTKYDSLHGLVNNAGSLLNEETRNSEGKEVTMATMLGGTHLLTALLYPCLKKASGRVVNVSSGGMYTVPLISKDLNSEQHRNGSKYDGAAMYAFAKRCQVALTKKWQECYGHDNVVFHSMHPGWTATGGVEKSLPQFFKDNKDMFRNLKQGADTIIWLLLANEATEQGGSFWFDRQTMPIHMRGAWTKYKASDVHILWDNANEFCTCQKDMPLIN